MMNAIKIRNFAFPTEPFIVEAAYKAARILRILQRRSKALARMESYGELPAVYPGIWVLRDGSIVMTNAVSLS
jgi:hypothetical protein